MSESARPNIHHAADAPAAPAIDFAHLRSQTLGDAALERELLDLFARQAKMILADLVQGHGHPAPGRLDDAGLLHTLSGSARAVGAWRVAEGAERLEQAARVTRIAPEPLQHLNATVVAACAAIDRHQGEEEEACVAHPQG